MVWLSSSDTEVFIGVEVDDDITVKLIDGEDITTIYEQAKHSQTSRIPYADRSGYSRRLDQAIPCAVEH
jgi:hypothetical protein